MTEQIMSSWELLHKNGACVSIRSSMWGGRCKLQPQDVGVMLTKEDWNRMQSKCSLGVKYLTDPEKLKPMKNLIQVARKTVEEFGLPMGELVGVAFIPNGSLEALALRLNEIEKKFKEARDVFLNEYPTIQEQWLEEYRQDAINILYPLYASHSGVTATQFAEGFIAKIRSKMPSLEEVKDKFALYWTVFELSAPTNSLSALPKNAFVMETQKKVSMQVDSFLTSMFDSVRSELLVAVGHALDVAKDGKKFGKPTIDALIQKVNKLRMFNFYNDQALSDAFAQLDSTLSANGSMEKEDFKLHLSNTLSKLTVDLEESINDKEMVLNRYKSSGRKITIV